MTCWGCLMIDHPRTEWLQGRPWSAPRILPERLDRIVIHYPGSAKPPSKPAAWMRQVHDARDYAFYYNFAVDVHGEVWEGRGFDCKNAANKGSNDQTVSICVHTFGAQPVNRDQEHAVRRLVATIRQRFGDLSIVGHRDVGATACPGDGVYRQVTSGVFEPVPEPVPVESEVNMIVVEWRKGQREFTACAYTGTQLAWLVNGHAAQVVAAAKAPVVQVSDQQFQGLIESSETVTAAPPTLPRQMAAAWAASRAR